jgi:hemerythrin superfamily protein
MARSTPTGASDSPRDAVTLLKQDHRLVESLFEEFASAEEGEQSSIAQRVCQLLTVHAQIEEELLYPAAKEALEDEEESELVYEAEIEHGSAKELIAKIEAMSGEEEQFAATVKVLGEYVKHHVKEEETELFPKLKKTELDLKGLGGRLAERKFALME